MAKKAGTNKMLATVGSNIACLTKVRGKTCEEMAQMLCMSRNTWHSRVSNPGSISLLELDAIAKALGTTPQRLLTETAW